MASVESLILRITAHGGRAAASEVEGVEGAIGRVGKAAKFMAGAAGIGALSFGLADVTKTAIAFQQQQGQLANSLRKTGQYSGENMRRLVEAADQLATHGGLVPEKNLGMLQRLLDATGSVNKSMRDMNVVTGLVRGGYGNYQAILRAVLNVEQGRTTGLGRLALVIHPVKTAQDALAASTKHATAEQKAHAKAIDAAATAHGAMQKLIHVSQGRTEAFNRSAAGAISNFRNSIDVLMQRLGKALLPAITQVVRALTNFLNVIPKIVAWVKGAVQWFEKHRLVAVALGGAIAGLAVALGGGAAAAGAMAIAGQALAAVMAVIDAIPIVALFAAIAVAIYLVITHFKEIKKVIGEVIDWITHHWKLVATILLAPIMPVVALIVFAFNHIKGVISGVFNWLKGAAHYFYDAFKTPVHAIIGLVTGVFKVVETVIGAVAGFLRPIVVGIFNVLKWPFDQVVKFVTGIFNGSQGTIGSILSGAISVLKTVWSGLTAILTAPFKALWDIVQQLIGPIQTVVNAANSIIGSLGTSTSNVTAAAAKKHPAAARRLNQITKGLATGGDVVTSGIFDVGEHGRERIYLPAGSAVRPQGATHHGDDGSRPLETTTIFQVGPHEFARAMSYAIAHAKAVS